MTNDAICDVCLDSFGYENDELIAQKSFYKTSCFPFFTNLRNFLKK